MTSLYKIYHGNLAFSAVEEESIPEVIDKCYFPLLTFIEKSKTPTGLELSAYSLEKIALYRPLWIEKFKALHAQNLIELIGSGYMQIIGPLVPYEVNIANQKIGREVYQQILGITPSLAYVNEQVFSKSMVDIYYEAGYVGIVMEWNNAFTKHKEWQKSYAFTPVIASGLKQKLPLLWTDSIIFQKFQRVIHSENIAEDYLAQITYYITKGYQALPIYTSDLEVFNYRPGRFETEALIAHNEWQIILETIEKLKLIGDFVLPSQVLIDHLRADINLTLTSNCTPVIVKKQQKYSLSRWAACGRGATYINHLCYNYFRTIKSSTNTNDWKKLLQYWGSDYRTHITLKKWADALDFLRPLKTNEELKKSLLHVVNDISVTNEKQQLTISKDGLSFTFLTLKGLCLKSIIHHGERQAIGTVMHGDLDFIHHGADYYTGTTVIDYAEGGRITDLCNVSDYKLQETENGITLSAVIPLKTLGKIEKAWHIDFTTQQLCYDANITLSASIKGSIRLGTITLIPQKHKELWYECKNGGCAYERYQLDANTHINHAQASSLLQSSQSGIGATDGVIAFGKNNSRILTINIDQTASYPFVMLQNSIDDNLFLTRLFFSLQELDDTLKEIDNNSFRLKYSINLQQ
ncbi:hypothetical protein [Psychromonas sp. MME2]|uniref:hypothetical protein n=1 Tax=unclassified Psychromonas TaxID=2614957 RepID=UPI00339CE95C